MPPPPSKTTPARTSAFLAFEQNLDFIAALVDLRGREVLAVHAATLRLSSKVKRHDILSAKKGELKKLTGSLSRLTKTHEAVMARIDLVTLWEVVMLVTCVEAYMQDVLSAAAGIDTDLMTKPEQYFARYADVVAALHWRRWQIAYALNGHVGG